MKYTAFIYYNNIRICKISYLDNDSDFYKYTFEPIYEALDQLAETDFKGIPGIDLALRKKKCIRENLQPVFIFERNPIRKKKNFSALQRIEQKTLLEYLTDNKTNYFGDKLTIRSL